MARIDQPRVWFSLAAVLGLAVLFFVGGAAGGVVAAVACAAFIRGAFRMLRDETPEDRTAGTGIFGRGL